MATLSPSRARAGRRGFSLLELVISFFLLVLALMIAAQLLRQAEQRLAAESRRARDPVAVLALRQLRWDVQAARGVDVGSGSGELLWTSDELELHGHPLGTVRYYKLGGELRREIVVAGETSTRVMLQGVSRWRWRYVNGGLRRLVEVELGVWQTGAVVGGSRQTPDVVEKIDALAVALRGSGGRAW